MHKNEYLELLTKAKKDIESKKEYIKNLEEQYIDINKSFLPGQKIKITYPSIPYYSSNNRTSTPSGYTKEETEYGYVIFNKVDILGRVIPTLVREKKDGTPSKVKLYYSPDYASKPKIEEA